jgi:hypothetical protein
VPLERRGRPPADQQEPVEGEPVDQQPDEAEGEPADDGMDWLREHMEARAAGGVYGAGGPLPPLAGHPTPSQAEEPPYGDEAPSFVEEPPAAASSSPSAAESPFADAPPSFAGEPPSLTGEPSWSADEWSPSAGGEPSLAEEAPRVEEAPAVRRLRETSAALDDELGLAGEQPGRGADPPAGTARTTGGRAPSIRPAPTPPDIRPAESLQPPGLNLPIDPRVDELQPPAAAVPPPGAAPTGDQAPSPGRPQLPTTPAERAGDWAGDREEPPLPGWDDLTPERLLSRQPGGPSSGW